MYELCAQTHVCAHHRVFGELTGQNTVTDYILLCGCYGLNLGGPTWWQMHLPNEPSLWTSMMCLSVDSYALEFNFLDL